MGLRSDRGRDSDRLRVSDSGGAGAGAHFALVDQEERRGVELVPAALAHHRQDGLDALAEAPCGRSTRSPTVIRNTCT